MRMLFQLSTNLKLKKTLFLEINRKLGESKPILCDELLFFGDQQKPRRKVNQPKNFGRPQNEILPP